MVKRRGMAEDRGDEGKGEHRAKYGLNEYGDKM